jgi:dolichol kinase
MVDLVFGDPTTFDVIMAAMTGIIGGIVLAIAYTWAERGAEKWKPRKIVHISMGTIIALTIMHYSNLSGPSLAAGIFLTILLYAWAHKSTLIAELLLAGSRKADQRLSTFAAGFMGMVAFASVFIFFFQQPEIIVASILAVSWGDAAGEVIGRPYGCRFIKKQIKGKSFEGFLGVFAFSCLSVIVAMLTFSSGISPLTVLPQIILVALVIAFIELLSIAWTDNFLIPIATAIVMWQVIFPATAFWFLMI